MTVKILGTEEIAIDELCGFPGNSRRSALPQIRESVEAHGQYRSLVVRRRTGKPDQILCGHGTRDALWAAGHTVARCELVECSDVEASKINVADNKIGDLGAWDTAALVAQLESFGDDFSGTGFSLEDAEKLFRGGMPEPGDADTGDDDGAGQWGVVVEVESEAEQADLLTRLVGEGFKVRALIQG
jgi:ParB-like chromosome segregation protein Spo0J